MALSLTGKYILRAEDSTQAPRLLHKAMTGSEGFLWLDGNVSTEASGQGQK